MTPAGLLPGDKGGAPLSRGCWERLCPYHCLVMSNIMTTPWQFLYTSRNSASRAISDSAWGREGPGMRWHGGRPHRWGPAAPGKAQLGRPPSAETAAAFTLEDTRRPRPSGVGGEGPRGTAADSGAPLLHTAWLRSPPLATSSTPRAELSAPRRAWGSCTEGRCLQRALWTRCPEQPLCRDSSYSQTGQVPTQPSRCEGERGGHTRPGRLRPRGGVGPRSGSSGPGTESSGQPNSCVSAAAATRQPPGATLTPTGAGATP